MALGPQSQFPAVLRRTRGVTVAVPEGLGPQGVAPSQPDALNPERGIYVRLPGADFPPAGAIPVDETGDANIAPGATGTIVSVVTPDTMRFRLAGIGFGADDETALGFLTWSILLGLDSSPGYVAKPATIGTLQQPADVFLLVGSSITVNVTGTPLASAVITYRYICRVRGWFYREDSA